MCALRGEGGLSDVIRCDEQNYLIWKWRPSGRGVNTTNKENSIRWGSALRVKSGSVAVFVYNDHGTTRQDYIEGPFDEILETSNLPVLSGILGLAYNGGTPFQAEVYFINLAQIIQTKFGVPYFDVFDPRFPDYGVPTAVRGTINFKITDYQEFIKLHRLDNFLIEDFQLQIRDAVTRYVKNVVINIPDQHNIPVVQLERKIATINDLIENDVSPRLFKDFGVTVSAIDVAAIEIDKSSEGYKQLKALTQDITTAKVEAQTEVEIKDMKADQKLGVFSKAANIYSDIKDKNYARRNGQTVSSNVAEKIGEAAAKGVGLVGNIGSSFVQNLGVTSNKNTANSVDPGVKMPPIPNTAFYVAKDGNPTGPFDITTLHTMVNSGQFHKNSLVWRSGMDAWAEAQDVNELSGLFTAGSQEMPPIPN